MKRERRRLVAAGGVALAAWAAFVVAVVPLVWDLTTAIHLVELVGGLTPVLTGATRLWRWGREVPGGPGTATLHKWAAKLAQTVFEQWDEEFKIRSLGKPEPMPVRWRLTTRELMHQKTVTEALAFTGTANEISGLVQQFRGLPHGRLVILGDPGAGKTTLAVQLVRELSRRKTRLADESVPVLLPVTGWNTEAHPRLQDWLIVRLAEDYPELRRTAQGSSIAERLVKNELVLPVLDDLDELADTARAAVICAINDSLTDRDGLILTSRTDEYTDAVTAAGDVLSFAAVIEPDPLAPADVVTYLGQCVPPDPGPEWKRVLAALDTGTAGPLTDVVTTPLNVWLLRQIYTKNRRNPVTLLEDRDQFPDATAIRSHLLDQLIPALLASPRANPGSDGPFRPRRRWNPRDAHRWLSYLAHHLTEHDTRDFAWWRLARHTRIYSARTKLAFGLMVGLAYLIAFGLTYGLRTGLVLGLSGFVIFGALADVGEWLGDEPGYANLRLHRPETSTSKIVLASVLAGLVVGLVLGVVAWLAGSLAFGLTIGPAAFLLTGFALGLVMWTESPALASDASTPGSSWRADRTLMVLQTLIIGCAFGLAGVVAFWLAGVLTGGFASGPVGGLMIGLAGGLPAGIVIGNHHAWLAYEVATHRLARDRWLPRRLMAFLDDAHRLGLLRAVGPVYQFRHADLHDHLAATHTTGQSAASASCSEIG